jgi:phage-related protein
MGSGLSTMGKEFGGVMPMLSSFAGEIPLVGGALSSLSLGPVALVIAALVALGVAIYEVGKAFGWWKDVGGMFDAIKTGVFALWDAFMSNPYVIQAIDLIKQGLTDAWNAIVGFGQAVMSALGGAGGQFDILAWAINGLQMVLNAVGPVVIMAIQGMIQYFRNIYTVAQIVWPYVAQIINGAIGVIRGIISGAMGIWSGLQGAWHGLQSTASAVFGAINGVVSAAGGAWQSFKSTVMGVIQPIIDKIHELKSVADGIGDFIGGLVGGGGGIETPTVNTGYGSGGYTTVSQGNTIIFNMYGDIRDERTLDETIDAINNRIQFDALANGIGDNGSGAI